MRITLTPAGSTRTRVTIVEDFTDGPLHWLWTKVNDLALHRRNVEALRRIEDLARARIQRTVRGPHA